MMMNQWQLLLIGIMIGEGEAMVVEPDLVEQQFPEDVQELRRNTSYTASRMPP